MITRLFISITSVFILAPMVFADSDSISIIPQWDKTKVEDAIEKVWLSWWTVIDRYNNIELSCEDQIASGIRNRWTIMCYAAKLVSFISQIWIAIWALMIIYAGYIYATAVFNGWNATAWRTAVIRAIFGIIIIVFSYAIVRIVTKAFLT